MDADYGEELWTTLRIDPCSDYDIRNVPIDTRTLAMLNNIIILNLSNNAYVK